MTDRQATEHEAVTPRDELAAEIYNAIVEAKPSGIETVAAAVAYALDNLDELMQRFDLHHAGVATAIAKAVHRHELKAALKIIGDTQLSVMPMTADEIMAVMETQDSRCTMTETLATLADVEAALIAYTAADGSPAQAGIALARSVQAALGTMHNEEPVPMTKHGDADIDSMLAGSTATRVYERLATAYAFHRIDPPTYRAALVGMHAAVIGHHMVDRERGHLYDLYAESFKPPRSVDCYFAGAPGRHSVDLYFTAEPVRAEAARRQGVPVALVDKAHRLRGKPKGVYVVDKSLLESSEMVQAAIGPMKLNGSSVTVIDGQGSPVCEV